MTDIILEMDCELSENACTPQRCFDLHRVSVREHYVTEHGRAVAWLAAPDIESVRMAVRGAGASGARCWPASICVGPEPGEANVLAGWTFAEPLERPAGSACDAAAWWLEVHGVKFLRAYVAGDGRRVLAAFQAADPEAVRGASQRAGFPVDGVWGVRRVPLALEMTANEGAY